MSGKSGKTFAQVDLNASVHENVGLAWSEPTALVSLVRPRLSSIARVSIAVAVAALGCTSVQAAPQGLYGKSIVVSWTEQRMQRLKGEGEFRPVTRIGGLSVYVSGAGRVFSRKSMTNPKRQASGSTDRVGSGEARDIAFEDRTMMVTLSGSSGGARRILVKFDDSFAGCTANVIRGKQEGADKIVASSVINPGRTVEVAEVKTSGESCSMKNGNVFGE